MGKGGPWDFSAIVEHGALGSARTDGKWAVLRWPGDPMGFSFMAHSLSQDATCADTLVYTFTFKERLWAALTAILDGDKQFLTKRKKFRPGGSIPGEIDLWLTIRFRSLLVVSLRWYLLLATFPVWLRVFSPRVLCCSSYYHHSYSPGAAGRAWHLGSNRARFKFCLPHLWCFVVTQLLLASHTSSRVLFCFFRIKT